MKLFLLIFGWWFHTSHDFHASMADIEYNSKSKSLQITLKVFTDDLELGVITGTGKKFLVNESKDLEPEIRTYIEGSFSIQSDGKVHGIDFIGKEFELDVIWIYLEIPMSEPPVKLDVTYCLLTELYSDQVNLANFRISDKRKTLIFRKDHCRQTLELP